MLRCFWLLKCNFPSYPLSVANSPVCAISFLQTAERFKTFALMKLGISLPTKPAICFASLAMQVYVQYGSWAFEAGGHM